MAPASLKGVYHATMKHHRAESEGGERIKTIDKNVETRESPSTSPVLSPKQINTSVIGKRIGKYKFGKTLGSGSTGKVKLGIDTETGEKVKRPMHLLFIIRLRLKWFQEMYRIQWDQGK